MPPTGASLYQSISCALPSKQCMTTQLMFLDRLPPLVGSEATPEGLKSVSKGIAGRLSALRRNGSPSSLSYSCYPGTPPLGGDQEQLESCLQAMRLLHSTWDNTKLALESRFSLLEDEGRHMKNNRITPARSSSCSLLSKLSLPFPCIMLLAFE